MKAQRTFEPVCSNGCPATLQETLALSRGLLHLDAYICRNFSRPSLRCSITSSENLFVNTLPGSDGIVTRVDSLSSISRKYSKSLYRLRTDDCFSLKAGMFVWTS